MAAFGSSKKLIAGGVCSLLLAAAMAVPTLVSAQEARGPATAPSAALDRNMGAINRAYRTVKAGAADKSKNEATLAALSTMQNATLVAKNQTPPSVEKLSGEEKAKKLLEYRTMMVKLLQSEMELEAHLLSGANDKAAETIAAIDAIQKSGHTAFRVAD